jgi:WD40 repeat protein
MIEPSQVPDASGGADEDQDLAEWLAERLEAGDTIAELTAVADPERGERLRMVTAAIGQIRLLRDECAATVPGPLARLGDFETVRVIGRGGMGTVYEAVQISLGRRVALKLLPSLAAEDPRRLARFQLEARAAAALNHPSIVPVYSVGSEGDLHFFVMRLIEGKTVATIIREGEHPGPRAVAELGCQIAEALHFAHEHGIVHRDVKPSNLMIDGAGRPWITDFGLARIGQQADLTVTGDVLGTLRYSSPEQAVGARAVVDHRTDIYSLGATLYEFVSLEMAFPGEDRFEVLRRIAEEEPKALSKIDRTIPRDLETIIGKAMAKNPAERYATAKQFAEDLARFRDDRPILARAPGLLDYTAKWCKRHRPAVAAAVLLLIAAAAVFAVNASTRNRVLSRHNAELKSALDLADRHDQRTRQLWHDSQMRLAQQSLTAGQTEFAQELLEGMRPKRGEPDPRGFDWRLLRSLAHREVSVLSGHEASVIDIAISPDGRTVASSDTDGVLIFWDLENGLERGRAFVGDVGMNALWFSPDGRVLAVRTVDSGKVRFKLWDPLTGRELSTLRALEGDNALLAFSPDGTRVLRGTNPEDGQSAGRLEFDDISHGFAYAGQAATPVLCHYWNVPSGGRGFVVSDPNWRVSWIDFTTLKAVSTLPGTFPGAQLAVDANGQTIAVIRSGSIAFWDTRSKRLIGTVATPFCDWLEFSSDGNRLVGFPVDREQEGMVIIGDVKTRPRAVLLEGMPTRNLRAAFTPDGHTLAVGGSGPVPVGLWDTRTGRRVAQLASTIGHASDLVFTPDVGSLVIGCSDGRIRVWHFRQGQGELDSIAGHSAEVWGLCYNADGSVLISAGDDHAIKLWNPRDGSLRRTLEGHESLVTSVAVSDDNRTLASAGFDKAVRLWDLPSGAVRGVLRGHTDRVRSVSFSGDGRKLASAGSDSTIRIWDVGTLECVKVLTGHTDTVRAVAFHPGRGLLVSASDDRTMRVWDVENALPPLTLPRTKNCASVAFSPDGAILASGDDWGSVTIWNVADWSRRTSVKGSDAGVFSLAFSRDGRTLAAGCVDAKVRLWDPLTGQVTLLLDASPGRVNAVVFSPDGRTLASASHSGLIRLWNAEEPRGPVSQK